MSAYRTKHGFQVYAAVLHGMRTPATGRQVAARHGLGQCSARALLRGLYSLGLLHVHGWLRVGPVGLWDRVYVAGPGVDAAPPLKSTGAPSHIRATKGRPKPALIAFAALWTALEEPSTVVQIVEETGLGQQAVYRFLLATRAAKITRIAGWQRVYNGHAALYCRGQADSVKRPARTPSYLISRRTRATAAQRRLAERLAGTVLPYRMAA